MRIDSLAQLTLTAARAAAVVHDPGIIVVILVVTKMSLRFTSPLAIAALMAAPTSGWLSYAAAVSMPRPPTRSHMDVMFCAAAAHPGPLPCVQLSSVVQCQIEQRHSYLMLHYTATPHDDLPSMVCVSELMRHACTLFNVCSYPCARATCMCMHSYIAHLTWMTAVDSRHRHAWGCICMSNASVSDHVNILARAYMRCTDLCVHMHLTKCHQHHHKTPQSGALK